MRLFLVIVAVIANEAIGQVNADNYTYEINARLTGETPTIANPIMQLPFKIESVQNLTYRDEVSEDKPFEIEGDVSDESDKIYDTKSLKTCDEQDDGTWDYVMVEMVNKVLTPSGRCPVEKGDYSISTELDPITVTFDDMLKCGDYEVYTYLTWHDWGIGELTFSFNIPNDGNCTPPDN